MGHLETSKDPFRILCQLHPTAATRSSYLGLGLPSWNDLRLGGSSETLDFFIGSAQEVMGLIGVSVSKLCSLLLNMDRVCFVSFINCQMLWLMLALEFLPCCSPASE